MATISATVARAMAATYKPTTTITKVGSYTTSASLSAGDIILFANMKLPHGAIVTEVLGTAKGVDGTFIFEAGTYGSNGVADVFGSKTFSGSAVIPLTFLAPQGTGLPLTISVSDDSVDRYVTFGIRVDGATASGTGSLSTVFSVQYYCP